jgi:release factor glutamine methyltransferase
MSVHQEADPTAFEWKGRCGPFEMRLSERTFPPSSISLLLGDAIDVADGETVLDVGCGCGVLGIVSALLGAGRVHGVDSAPDTAEVAEANAQRLGVADRTTFTSGDLFEPIPDDVVADLVIGDVSGIPDTLARVSGWFPDGRGGGASGVELPVRLVEKAPGWLSDRGRLLLPSGSLQDEQQLLAAARDTFAHVEKVGERRLPLPQNIAATSEVEQLWRDGVIDLEPRGSRLLWYARAWYCQVAA